MEARDIIIAPVLSEKSYRDIENKKYVFRVAKSANKTEIKLAIEQIFGVSVDSVNTINCLGKKKRMGRYEGYTPAYKKAIVQLKDDSKAIAFFESLS
ncbi:MAG: 50S ribosomal protein L23 [Clostridia bacterium]|nr:50S ribosomal protein L23 [Clostridia bacterium]